MKDGEVYNPQEFMTGILLGPATLGAPNVSASAKLVLGRLVWYAIDQSAVNHYPNLEALSHELGMTKDCTLAAINELKDLDLLPERVLDAVR